jgi:hypothetical protein
MPRTGLSAPLAAALVVGALALSGAASATAMPAALSLPSVLAASIDASITAVPAPSNSRHRKWIITFTENVGVEFQNASLTPTGTMAGSFNLTYKILGTEVIVLATPSTETAEGTLGFELEGPIFAPGGGTYDGPDTSPLHTIDYHPPGDMNKDGVFDVSDVLLLSNAAVGAATLP